MFFLRTFARMSGLLGCTLILRRHCLKTRANVQRIQAFTANTWWLPKASPTKIQEVSRTRESLHTHISKAVDTETQESICYTQCKRAGNQTTAPTICSWIWDTQSHHTMYHVQDFNVHFSLYDLEPSIWCRGPLPKAHWYMHTDSNNQQDIRQGSIEVPASVGKKTREGR